MAQNVTFATSQRGRNSFLFQQRNMLQMWITEKGPPPNDGPIAKSPHRIDLSSFFLPANFSCLHEVYFSYGPLCWAQPFRRKWNDQNWCIRSGVFRGVLSWICMVSLAFDFGRGFLLSFFSISWTEIIGDKFISFIQRVRFPIYPLTLRLN